MRRAVLVVCLVAAFGCGGQREPLAPAPDAGVGGGAGALNVHVPAADAGTTGTGRETVADAAGAAGGTALPAAAGGAAGTGGAGPTKAMGGMAAISATAAGGTGGVVRGTGGAGGSLPVTCSAIGAGVDGGAQLAAAPEQAPALAPCESAPALSTALRLAPVDPGQHYVRCATHGPELTWKVTASPHGHFLAARTAGAVRLIDVASWREIVQLGSPVGQLDAVAFSPDGSHLATVSAESGQVTLWRTSDGTVERSWALTPASNLNPMTASLSFSSDGRMLATSLSYPGSAGQSGVPAVIDIAGPAVLQAPAVNPDNWAYNSTTRFVKFVGGDSMLLVDSSFEVGNSPPTEVLSLYRPPCGPSIALFEAWEDTFAGYAASPDGQFVAFASRTSESALGLSVVAAASGAVMASDPTFLGQVLAFTPDSAAFYVQQDDVVTALDPRTLAHLRSVSVPAGASFKAVAPDGKLVLTTSASTVWLDPATGAVTRTLPFAIDDAVWSGDGALEVDTGGGSVFDAFQTAGGAELCKLAVHPGAITTFAASALGTYVAFGHDDGKIEVESADASAPPQRFATNVVPVTAVSVSDDGRRVAVPGVVMGTGSSRQVPVTIFDVANGSAVAKLTFPAAWSSGAGVLSSRGAAFALGFMDATATIRRTRAVDVASGEVRLDLLPSSLTTGYDVPDHFSSDENQLAVVTDQGVGVWSLSDGTRVKTFGSGTLGLSPWWTYVASGTSDGSVRISWAFSGTQAWTFPADGFPNATFDGDEQIVSVAAFVGHTHAIDYFAQHVWDLTNGASLRVFGSIGGVVLPRGGEQILTSQGGDVAIWCR